MTAAGLSNSNLAPTQNLTEKHKRAFYIYFGQDKTPPVSAQTCGIDLNTQQYHDFVIKGTVARDFWPLVFFMNQPHMGP